MVDVQSILHVIIHVHLEFEDWIKMTGSNQYLESGTVALYVTCYYQIVCPTDLKEIIISLAPAFLHQILLLQPVT